MIEFGPCWRSGSRLGLRGVFEIVRGERGEGAARLLAGRPEGDVKA